MSDRAMSEMNFFSPIIFYKSNRQTVNKFHTTIGQTVVFFISTQFNLIPPHRKRS